MDEPVEILGKVCITTDKKPHSSDNAYEKLTIVKPDNEENIYAIVGVYLSVKNVPTKIDLTNTDYWFPIIEPVTVEELKNLLNS